jgi:benzoylformate decarboxylase
MDIDNPAIDYVALARGFGLPARRVTRARDIAPAIEAGIASGQANVVEVMIACT